jgi:regulator of chromosome condensation
MGTSSKCKFKLFIPFFETNKLMQIYNIVAQTSSSSSSAGAIPGTVYAVGNGEVYGENGMSDIPELTYPLCVDELEYEPIIDIASSNFHSLALNRYGKVKFFMILFFEKKVIYRFLIPFYCLKLWSWGCKEYGALGRTGVESGPRPINHPSIRNIKFSKIACGNTISIAITANGQLYTWGTFTVSIKSFATSA